MNIYTPTSHFEIHCATGDYYNPGTYPTYHYADGADYQYVWSGVNSNDKRHRIYSYADAAEDLNTASSPLWGNTNTFYGTNDADNFFLGKNDGNDLVFDAAQNDNKLKIVGLSANESEEHDCIGDHLVTAETQAEDRICDKRRQLLNEWHNLDD